MEPRRLMPLPPRRQARQENLLLLLTPKQRLIHHISPVLNFFYLVTKAAAFVDSICLLGS
jgi:hypothetical protein